MTRAATAPGGREFARRRLLPAWPRTEPPARRRPSTSRSSSSSPPSSRAAAPPAAGDPGRRRPVGKTVRTGICIVGGDLCRTADAAAAGLAAVRDARALEPAGHDARHRGRPARRARRVAARAAVRRRGGRHAARGERGRRDRRRRADVQSRRGSRARRAPPRRSGYRGGKAWRFADAAAAARVPRRRAARRRRAGRARAGHALGRAHRRAAARRRAPRSRTSPAPASRPRPSGAIGLRRDGARRTLTLDLGAEDPGSRSTCPASRPAPAGLALGRRRGHVGGRRGLASSRCAARRRTDGRLEEITGAARPARAREPRARRAAAASAGADARGPARAGRARIATHGVVERAGYAVTERRRGVSVAGRLGIALGLSHERITAERRLVDAIAWVRGGPPQHRFDCLGV